MLQFSSIQKNKIDSSRYREPNRPELNISIVDVKQLLGIFNKLNFPGPVQAKIQGDLDIENMIVNGIDINHPIDIRLQFPGDSNWTYAAEVAHAIINLSSKWEIFKVICTYFYPREVQMGVGAYVLIAFRHFPMIERGFIREFEHFNI